MAPKTPWFNEWHAFWLIFGSPLELRNQSKIDVFARKGAPSNLLLSIFVTNTDFLNFLVDVWSIWDKISMNKTMYWLTSALDFFKLATLTKHCNLRYESYFFFLWGGGKMSAKLNPGKTSKKGANWDPKWTPNSWKLRWENLETHQNGPEN